MIVSPPIGSRHEMNCPGRWSKRGPARKSERVSGACSTIRATRASSSTATPLDLLVDGVARHDDDDLGVGVLDDGLAPEPRRRRETRRLVEEIVLGFLRRREMLPPLLHDHVARRARAVAAARVLEGDAVAEEDVEDRGRLAVVLERRLSRIELDRPLRLAALVDDADARHPGSVSGRRTGRDLSERAAAV